MTNGQIVPLNPKTTWILNLYSLHYLSMSLDDKSEGHGFCETCVCGRTFSQPGALSYHKRSCSKSKKRFSDALAKAKEVWNDRKRRRVEGPAKESRYSPPQQALDLQVAGESFNEFVTVRIQYPTPSSSDFII